jgi:poly-gamma-glutamate synthesis protein (capsule biosynthesis protein)
MLGTSVKRTLLARGPRSIWRKYRPVLSSADLTFANLETPLSNRGYKTPGKRPESLRTGKAFIFRTPPSAAEGLRWTGFDVLSVANNHTMDYQGPALEDTLHYVRKFGMLPVGAGKNLDEARRPVFLERKGQRFAFLAACDILTAFSAAEKHVPGVAPAQGAGFPSVMPKLIAAARKKADWVIVSVHWGKERYPGATGRQRSLGHQLVDWGADAVIGHHTHCLGPVERYKKGVIHYSLGNFMTTAPIPGGRPAWELTFRKGKYPGARSLFLKN